jgi:RNA polymerase sigma factor (sigma-70 family)
MTKLGQQLRAIVHEGDGDVPDGMLLDAFVRRRDPAALTALVRRYSPMVWGVCSRVLRNRHDAEDAAQAAFLVLVAKAASINDPTAVCSWLYGVAHKTAVRLRTSRARRARREQHVALPESPMPAESPDNDLRQVIDDELSRLPDRYRTVVLLCDLEGRTRADAARLLDLPEGTIASRLARARAMLGKRLIRRGVAAGAVACVAPTVATAGAPALMVASTIQMTALYSTGQTGAVPPAVSALAKEVLFTMTLKKILTRVLVLFVGLVVGAGGAVALARTTPAEPAGPGTPNAVPPKVDPAGPKELAMKSNPLFEAWRGLKGKTLTFKRKTWISGGPPPGDTRLASETTVTYTVADVTTDRAAIEVAEDGQKADKPVVVVAGFALEAKDVPVLKGEEEIEIGKGKKKCKVYQYQQREGFPIAATINVWVADSGVVKKTISYTVKASYFIEETLVPR